MSDTPPPAPLALPADFSPWEHLQDTLRLAHNQQVQTEFIDVEVDNDLKAPRSSLKLACLIQDNDSAMMVVIRLILYHVVIKGFGLPEVYSVPISTVNEGLRYKPQIHLQFRENARDIRDGVTPVESQIKFRLMTETTATLSQADSLKYANKIKTIFGSGNGLAWARGKDMFTYADQVRGYNMQLLVQNEAAGRLIVEKVLSIQDHTPDWKFANYKKNLEATDAYPTSPPNKTILGKSVRAFHLRPVTTIRFRTAFLHVEGLPKPVVLYDKTQHYKKSLLHD
ncbi:hypothetical protein HCU40_16755 [Pseudanabaena biceps]|nr:hypothetical protein [Pseudanabaena biceps]